MTTENNQASENNDQNIDDDYVSDAETDPMLVAMREAEKELAAAEGKDTDNQDPEEGGESGEQKPDAEAADKQQSPMIPKARLDQALSERDKYKEAAVYLQGIVDTQGKLIKEGAPKKEAGDGQESAEDGGNKAPASDDYAALISKAEQDRLDLAQKYEDGEISLVEMEKGRIELERSIRALDEKRVQALVEESKNAAKSAVTENNVARIVNDEGLKLEADHPYIKEIDALPEYVKQGVWAQITEEAAQNLIAKGVNVNDGTLETHLALMREKSALTDVYGPRYTGKQLQKSGSDEHGKPQKSQAVQDRLNKLELSNNQPPYSGQSRGADNHTELTEAYLENLSSEEMADLMRTRGPEIERLTGIRI